jgi:hypothetical protein
MLLTEIDDFRQSRGLTDPASFPVNKVHAIRYTVREAGSSRGSGRRSAPRPADDMIKGVISSHAISDLGQPSVPPSGRPDRTWIAGAIGPTVMWSIGLAACLATHRWSACISAAIWGLVLLGSFCAWGKLVGRALRDERPFGWGMDGAIGMALTVWVFGGLACFRMVSAPAVVVWSAAGPLLFAADRVRSGPPARAGFDLNLRALLRRWSPAFTVALALLSIVAALQYAHATMNATFNAWDDEMAYRSYIRQFLDTGTLLDGFSFRRVGAYGGQSLLQAFVLALSNRDRVHILDNGICLLLTLGLITGYRGRNDRNTRAAVVLAGFLLLTLPYYLHNLGGEFSGLMFFLALFRVYDDPEFETASPRSNAVAAGLLAAAICTLRQNYMSAAIGFVALVHLALVWSPASRSRRDWLRQAGATAATTFWFLLPWIVLSAIAIHTPLYPVMRGNVRPDFGMSGHVTFDEEVRWGLANLFMFTPVSSIALFFIAVVLLPPLRRHRAIQMFMFANMGAFALMMHFFKAFHDAASISRYYFSFSVAFCLAATLRVVAEDLAWPARKAMTAAIALVAVGVGYQFLTAKETILNLAFADVTAFNDLVRARGPFVANTPTDVQYRRLQASVPRGQPILVMLDHTYLLDGRRNPIFNYDHPGTMGPHGGPPAFKGPEALATYLQSVGIRYVAFQIGPSSPEYDVGYWERKIASAVVVNGRGNFYKVQGKFELDSFAALKALAGSRRVVFNEGDIQVIDLGTRT